VRGHRCEGADRLSDPFKIDGPTCISFSGGRTSAYMLWRVLQSNGGLPADSHVIFANTGKEAEETLVFVRECSERWSVPIIWTEYRSPGHAVVVDFETASRQGEPFAALIKDRNYLPNPVARFCTVELKILRAVDCMEGMGYDEHENFVGIRADEPVRVRKIMANPSGGTKGVERRIPLAMSGVTKATVGAFWKAQPFDLGLPSINGETPEGNCDLCFLKHRKRILSLIAAKPERAVWWIAQEGSITNPKVVGGGYFRNDRATYAQMAGYLASQEDAFGHDETDDEEAIACFCGD
jgi:3'-phosphoadenosine 5'-phosphosulfate sulfotransferase (PAPS reductase)/FAD synthetase